jgi:hypothetical protein
MLENLTEVRNMEEKELEWEKNNYKVEKEYVRRHLELFEETANVDVKEQRLAEIKAETTLELGEVDFLFSL